jgi:hypothetical protein
MIMVRYPLIAIACMAMAGCTVYPATPTVYDPYPYGYAPGYVSPEIGLGFSDGWYRGHRGRGWGGRRDGGFRGIGRGHGGRAHASGHHR